MTEQPAPPPADPAAAGAEALRAYAARERGQAEQLAAALEEIAAHGMPPVEQCRTWAEIREAALASIHGRRAGGNAA